MNDPVAYGVKIPLCVDVVVAGCHGCTVECYALSYPDSGDLQEVTLFAEPVRRANGSIDPTFDDVGEVLSENERTIERQFLASVLYREARKPENTYELTLAYAERFRYRRDDAKAESFLTQTRGL